MNAVNNSCGALSVHFSTDKNPGIFQKNTSYVLKRFDLYGMKCVLVSEGSRLTVITDNEKSSDKELLSVSLPKGMERHVNSIVLKWYNDKISLHADVCLTGKEMCNA